jgi:hypothetical protein
VVILGILSDYAWWGPFDIRGSKSYRYRVGHRESAYYTLDMGEVSTVLLQGVGRGGQFLLAFISWRVFAKYLTVCMDIQPINYRLFRTVFLENEASLPSTFNTIRGFVWQRKLRSKTAMIFMATTMIFIIAFPTLTSAMSGYDANVASYVPEDVNNPTYLPFKDFSRALYVIHDGWRIKEDGNYYIKDETGSSGSMFIPRGSISSIEPADSRIQATQYYLKVHTAVDGEDIETTLGVGFKILSPSVR